MSLINEALRKARQAASEHDSKQPEGAFRPAKAYPSRRKGRSGTLWTMLVIAVAAGALGAAAVWFVGVDRQPSVVETVSEVEPLIQVAAPGVTPEPSPAPEIQETRVDTTDVKVAETTVAPPVEQALDDLPDTAAIKAESRPGDDSATPAAAKPGERVFVMEANLGGTTLSLGYIVARSNNPFAEINGIDVHIGSEIEGFVVELIEADRVVLRDDEGPLVLRVP